MNKLQLLQAIKNGRLERYLSENWWKMDRADLYRIIVQLLFTMYDNDLVEEDIDMNELLERLDLEELEEEEK